MNIEILVKYPQAKIDFESKSLIFTKVIFLYLASKQESQGGFVEWPNLTYFAVINARLDDKLFWYFWHHKENSAFRLSKSILPKDTRLYQIIDINYPNGIFQSWNYALLLILVYKQQEPNGASAVKNTHFPFQNILGHNH